MTFWRDTIFIWCGRSVGLGVFLAVVVVAAAKEVGPRSTDDDDVFAWLLLVGGSRLW